MHYANPFTLDAWWLLCLSQVTSWWAPSETRLQQASIRTIRSRDNQMTCEIATKKHTPQPSFLKCHTKCGFPHLNIHGYQFTLLFNWWNWKRESTQWSQPQQDLLLTYSWKLPVLQKGDRTENDSQAHFTEFCHLVKYICHFGPKKECRGKCTSLLHFQWNQYYVNKCWSVLLSKSSKCFQILTLVL